MSLLHHICILLRFWCNLGLRNFLLHRQPANREVMLSVCEPGDTEVNSQHQGWPQLWSRASVGRFGSSLLLVRRYAVYIHKLLSIKHDQKTHNEMELTCYIWMSGEKCHLYGGGDFVVLELCPRLSCFLKCASWSSSDWPSLSNTKLTRW